MIFLIVAGVLGGTYIVSRMKLKFPEQPASAVTYSSVCYVDDGLYYVKNNIIKFLDRESMVEEAVCNKPNCGHSSRECNAYVEDISPIIMYYNGDIFIADDAVKIDHLDGESFYTGSIRLNCLKADGSKKYNIYSADNGAVATMKAIDDKLYFTAYKFHGEFDVDNYKYDQMLYEYDLRWKKLKQIHTIVADESQMTSNYQITLGNSSELYATYELYAEDGNKTKTLFKRIGDDMSEIAKYMNEDMMFIFDSDKQFIIRHFDDNDMSGLFLFEDDKGFGDETELFRIQNARADIMDGYILFINSDYKKVLYDYNRDILYVANTSFSEQGKYISDIYDIDRNNNSIYYNETDYTGIMPGTLFYEDTSKKTIGKLDEFINNNFVAMEDVSDEEMAKLSWISFPE